MPASVLDLQLQEARVCCQRDMQEASRIKVNYMPMLFGLTELAAVAFWIANRAVAQTHSEPGHPAFYILRIVASAIIWLLFMTLFRFNPGFQKGGFRIPQFVLLLLIAIFLGSVMGALSYLGGY